MITSTIRNITRKGTNKILSLIPINRETEGLPEDISFAMLNRLCLSCLDDPLNKVKHSHLSGWKSSNTYRLKLECEGGSQWSLIYKNAVYSKNIIPALVDFPLKPGRAEYAVYSSPALSLKHYLPEVYICNEVTSGIKYIYLIEDLSNNYRLANKRADVHNAVILLTNIYRDSGEIILNINKDLLPKYDSGFSSELKKYVLNNLESYLRHTKNNYVSEICRLWNGISTIYDRKNNYSRLSCFVHGDPNLTNILVNKKNNDQLKLIDWEWAGIGLPHQDLASLLKRATPSVEMESLRFFSKSNNLLSLSEHRELYEICQIERGLIDCSFFASQKINSTGETKINFDAYIEDSALRVLRAYDRLT
ncbi:MAG: phosphotransferase family protein [Thermodesulfobacteriota bacterium]